MVVLNKIYTRTGDDGTTALGTGERRKKYDLRIAAYGTLDETNSVIGIARLHTAEDAALDAALSRIQNDLFDVGADLTTPGKGKGPGGARLTVTAAQVDWLEVEIDRLNDELAPLRSFILPGGSAAAAYLHLARTVCRRAERLIAELSDKAGRERHAGSAEIRQSAVRFPVRRRPSRQRQGRARRAVEAGTEPLNKEPGRIIGGDLWAGSTTRSPSSPARRAASAAPARSCSRAKAPALVIVDQNAEGLAETAKLIAKDGGSAQAMTADTGREEDVKSFVKRALDSFGALDAIYANAGVSGGLVPLFEQTVEQWQQILQTNLIGPFLAIKHAGAHMVKQGRGSIVLTASVAGLRANAGGLPYSASKAGVVSLAQTAANAFLGTGVRVNAICPGLIETGMTQPIFERARERGTQGKIGQLNPLQRAGGPQEIAAMALFLASDEASYVNGQAFPVDGGLTSTLPFTKPIR